MAEKRTRMQYPVKIEIEFDKDNIDWLREKFEIKTKADLYDVILECISTYMEM